MAFALEILTLENKNFRQVIHTTAYQQLVLMSVKDEIGLEVHPYTDQFIRIESGEAKVIVDDNEWILRNGDSVTVSKGSYHNVINVGDKALKLYTIYSPPHHPDNLTQKFKP
jgi:mannose-6-phosphate isomerase-like protein (cupin superfamily)